MERFGIETTQNVFIEHEIANIGERILAQILDFIFIFLYTLLIYFIMAELELFDISLFYLLFLPIMFYSLINEMVFHGQSLGKMIVRIKVIRMDGTEPTFGNYIMRWLLRIADIWISNGAVAVITVIATGKGQRVGDIAAGTMVVKLRVKPIEIDTVYKKLKENYELVHPEVKYLADEDVNTINDVLKHYKKNKSESAVVILNQTCKAIEKKTGITAQQHPVLFLETILKDYNYINRDLTTNA